ncbi:MAG: hypothetical protein A3I11_05865 [Elusimicrobia bacterium RIFCSPLOWO2_02_FULL_39_32]|nr:MAG: hypothetical protein A2034_04265 [Elusimicrobia bacterium GWA2_38_7]OGR80664.1 MAG: hypothetical protein A3B80_04045 [Elusimicrobia bacterium RIFCSPHIGHO2_02_FULL_39_36]OGR91513.1 MAG: hypothetical protein A3I11_05865 [Elusimicrobia bacterium RIFCSPLOWO2_02_FULL_39_32]OGS00768.1 MAG: hypothetical protein A3G85_04465 [Elusimicrobia bacterium RIFCSPLOWO2_12_FULL_39_28]
MKNALTPFRNIKFNIYLFAVLALASLVGTLIPQMPENPDRVKEFIQNSPKWGAFFEKIEFFNIYYSWWYIGLLALMAFNLIVCKIIFDKFPGLKTFKKEELEPSVLEKLSFQKSWMTNLTQAEFLERAKQALHSKRYTLKVIQEQESENCKIFASKYGFQRFGSWVSHISILIVLAANLTGALYGFRETLNLTEGTASRMQNRPWTVACDKFRVDWYPQTSTPKTFASSLRVFEKGLLVENKEIVVNEPLEYKKVRFYQASYGPYLKEARIGFFLRKDPKKSPTVTLRLDEESPVPGTPYSLRILQFIPDFSMDENRQVSSRSVQANNPALQILVSRNGKPFKAPWIFENFPTLQMPPVQKEDEFILVLAEYVPAYYTGLQIAYDPGADFFWIACSILVLGLMVLFYFHQRKIWIFLSKDSLTLGTQIRMGAASSRGRSFENEFLGLVQELEKV